MHSLVVFLGLIQGPEFGPNAEKFLCRVADRPPMPGVVQDLDRASFFLSLLSGSDFFGTGRALMIVSQILTLVQAALWMTGYGMCLAIENRMGTRGQLITLFCLSGVNLVLNVFFGFLPLLGAIRYVWCRSSPGDRHGRGQHRARRAHPRHLVRHADRSRFC